MTTAKLEELLAAGEGFTVIKSRKNGVFEEVSGRYQGSVTK